jgi:hypothetical protein
MIRGLIAVLLALGALATLGVGLASYWRDMPREGLWISGTVDEPQTQLAALGGTLYAVYCEPRPQSALAETQMAYAGFSFKTTTFGGTLARGVGAPFWAPAVLLLPYPILVLARGPIRRRRRRRKGLCIHCGYDLRGLTETRCPECGETFEPERLPDIGACEPQAAT